MAVLPRGTVRAGRNDVATQGHCLLRGTVTRGRVKGRRRQVPAQGGRAVMEKQKAGDKEVKRVKAAGKVQTKNYVVLKEHVGELQRVLDGKKSSLR